MGENVLSLSFLVTDTTWDGMFIPNSFNTFIKCSGGEDPERSSIKERTGVPFIEELKDSPSIDLFSSMTCFGKVRQWNTRTEDVVGGSLSSGCFFSLSYPYKD